MKEEAISAPTVVSGRGGNFGEVINNGTFVTGFSDGMDHRCQ